MGLRIAKGDRIWGVTRKTPKMLINKRKNIRYFIVDAPSVHER